MPRSFKSLLLAKGHDDKVRQGYPWVFSGNLISSVKEIKPGEVIELKDHKGKFVARGYCHPKTNLCIRVLSRDASEKDLLSKDFFLRRLQRAWDERKKHDWNPPSFRWLFSDSDFVPGLVLDLFTIRSDSSSPLPFGYDQLSSSSSVHAATEGSPTEVLLVSQISTLGMQEAVGEFEAALHEWANSHWEKWSWIEANVSNARKLEGLVVERPMWRYGKVRNWNQVQTEFKNLDSSICLAVDFMDGQKTGFFLDQQWNVQNLLTHLKCSKDFMALDQFKVLDLFCYVGQWGTHLAKLGQDLGKTTSVDFADVSVKALELAMANAKAIELATNSNKGFSNTVQTFDVDIMREDWNFSSDAYDIVICDPPAFVKKREDLKNAEGAYVDVFSEALRLVKPGGFVVLSSCSGLVRRDLFTRIVDKAQKLADQEDEAAKPTRWTWKKLSHGPDHPLRSWFPEGEYLKCWIGQREVE